MKNYIIIFSVLSLLFSCDTKSDDRYYEESIALNNQAMKLMTSNPDSALLLLNKATQIDPNNYIAYSNKVSIYISKKEIDLAIKSAQKSVIAKPELAESHTLLGMLYDYTGEKNKAKEQYSKALEIYNNRIASSENNKYANRINRAQTLLLLDNRLEGEKEVQDLFNENPDDFNVQMLTDFNKEQYLNSLFR